MAGLTPLQEPPRWNHTPEEVIQLISGAITKRKVISDEVAALSPAECNFDTVFARLADAEGQFDVATQPLTFYQNVATSKELRDASTQAEQLQKHFGIEESMRLDVFQAKVAAEENLHVSGAFEKLTSEQQRLVEQMVLDGKRAGLALPEEERTKLAALQKELSQVVVEAMVRTYYHFRPAPMGELLLRRETLMKKMVISVVHAMNSKVSRTTSFLDI